MEDFNAYTINQLRMILKELNINASGKKVNLIEKIKQYKYKDYNICFFDTETTGVTSNDYIIQCTLIIYNIYLDNEKEYNFYIKYTMKMSIHHNHLIRHNNLINYVFTSNPSPILIYSSKYSSKILSISS